MFIKLERLLTPLRSLSFMLLVLASLDHLYNPFLHSGVDSSFPEILVRTVFFFCGVYGILGNGKHIQIRATIIGFPFIYLAVIYAIKLAQTGVQTIIIPLTFSTLIGFWTLVFGAYHEHRTASLFNCLSNRNYPKSNH